MKPISEKQVPLYHGFQRNDNPLIYRKIMRIAENIWLILFVVWGFPLAIYRSKFRKMVYHTSHWSINIQPRFGKEIRALFGNLYPDDPAYIKFRNFYRFYLSVYLLLFTLYFSIPSSAQSSTNTNPMKIEKGSKLPSFSLPDQHGNILDINTLIGTKNLVVYFYPKDDSPGCTKEACYFRDQFEVFSNADALIIGISGQSVESHRKFAEKYHLSFTLLSDKDNKVRKMFGVPTDFFGVLPGRVTYIADKTGTVVYVFDSQSQATKHVDEALRILKSLNTPEKKN
jgi:thioredoxin-dependent peroxiredoxin